MYNPLKSISTFLVLIVATASITAAQTSTSVIVRAKAKDAKFIGDGMGGAMITITDQASGDTLARGLTSGDTGDTQRLVKEPTTRYKHLSTPGAARFEADLMLKEPRLITIYATAPYNSEEARITASVQQWVIPGEDIKGDGIILEIPGFVISNETPETGHSYRVNRPVPIRTHLVMMCGCPTSDGGLWDSSTYTIRARISKGGKHLKSVPLSFTGRTNYFKGEFTPDEQGAYDVTVYAFHPETANTGVDTVRITVES